MPGAPNRRQSLRHYREEFAETMAERGEGELITFPGVAAFGHGDGERKKGKDSDDEKKGQCARSKVGQCGVVKLVSSIS